MIRSAQLHSKTILQTILFQHNLLTLILRSSFVKKDMAVPEKEKGKGRQLTTGYNYQRYMREDICLQTQTAQDSEYWRLHTRRVDSK